MSAGSPHASVAECGAERKWVRAKMATERRQLPFPIIFGIPFQGTFRELAAAVATRGIPTVVARESDEIQRWGCCVTARFLHPIEPLYADPNNASIVMRVTHGAVDALFTGDIEFESDGVSHIIEHALRGCVMGEFGGLAGEGSSSGR